MKRRKLVYLMLLVILTNFVTGCNKDNIKTTESIKSKIVNFINKKEEKDKNEKINTIADSIKINLDKYKIINDYENKPTIVLNITYKNLSKDTKVLDSDDITLYQGKYKLKSVYDTILNTEAFYEEIAPNESKSFCIGYRVEGDNDFTLKFNPFLSKKVVKLDIKYPEKNKV